MKVTSSLADIDFQVGSITRQGQDLVVSSGPGSTIDTQIRISPGDAKATLGRVMFNGAVWGFLLSLIRPGRGQSQAENESQAWEVRRRSTGVNKPW